MAKKKMVPYSEIQDNVAAKRRDTSQGRLEQVDELHSLINRVPGHPPVPHPLRGKQKAKGKSTKARPGKRGRGRK